MTDPKTERTYTEKAACPYEEDRKDINGEQQTHCTRTGTCSYQRNILDREGNITSLCERATRNGMGIFTRP